jgi:hypothetical protein
VAELTEDGEESVVAAVIRPVSACSGAGGWTNGKEDMRAGRRSAPVAGISHGGRITAVLDGYSVEAERERKREQGSARCVVENEEEGWGSGMARVQAGWGSSR